MTWLIIGVILLVAFGPVMWLMPSKRDRYLSGLRQQAHREGLVVELRRVPKLNAAPEERVSAGGRVREPVVECMAYSLMLPQRLKLLGGWRLLRAIDEEIPAVPEGWVLDPGMRDAKADVAAVSELLPAMLAELPEDVIGVELNPGALAVYWLEKPGAELGAVTALRVYLERFGKQLIDLDERKLAELEADDS